MDDFSGLKQNDTLEDAYSKTGRLPTNDTQEERKKLESGLTLDLATLKYIKEVTNV